jgi:NAD(P)-dependent dehydrogenase (short-subunit alcohol dehydrogenase family)
MPTDNTVHSTTKIAILTGGNRGMGRSTVLALAKRGVHSIFTYNTNRAEADAVVGAVRERGANAVAIQLDVRDVKSFDGFVQKVRSALSDLGAERFDYLVNSAGTGLHKLVTETTEADFDQLVNVQLKGPFFLTQKLLPLLADGGMIVNISSGLARFAVPTTAAYSMMKGGIEVFTRVLAKELGSRKITVNSIAPGAIQTDFNDLRDNVNMRRMVESATALGRVGMPDDVGPMIAAFLSDANHFVNAQRIEVSGGMFI